MLEKVQLPHVRVDDLRHSAASLLLAERVPVKVASEMLGHWDVATTLRIYAHVIEGAQEQARPQWIGCLRRALNRLNPRWRLRWRQIALGRG
jgi:integrase